MLLNGWYFMLVLLGDESLEYRNWGKFLEMIKLLASYNKEVDKIVTL